MNVIFIIQNGTLSRWRNFSPKNTKLIRVTNTTTTLTLIFAHSALDEEKQRKISRCH